MALNFASRVALISLLTLMVAACDLFSVSRNDLIGDFQIDRGYGVETLRLMRDGKYTQSFRLAAENTWTINSGTWDFKTDPREEVELHNAMRVDDGSGKPRADFQRPQPGIWRLPVKRGFRTVSLVVDETRSLMMAKLAPPLPADHKPDIITLPPSDDVKVN
jgi:hypothetical protein